MLRLMNYSLYVNLDECAQEMRGTRQTRNQRLPNRWLSAFPKCALFYLDPITDNESEKQEE